MFWRKQTIGLLGAGSGATVRCTGEEEDKEDCAAS